MLLGYDFPIRFKNLLINYAIIRVPYSDILDRARIRSMYSLLSQRRLRWLGHVRRTETAACRKTSSKDNSPVARGQWDAQPSDSRTPAIVT